MTVAASGLSAAHRLRRLANLVNGSTLVGLGIARLGRARVSPGPDGLILAEGYRLGFPVAGAFTVGNVVITGSTFAELRQWAPQVLDHEARHCWQYVCTGWLFLPLYVAAMGWSVLRTGDRAARNPFERGAGLRDGGYADAPVLSWRQSLAFLRPSPRRPFAAGSSGVDAQPGR